MHILQQKLEELRQFFDTAAEDILAIKRGLDEGKLPLPAMVDGFSRKFHDAADTEAAILSKFEELNGNVQKGSINDYLDSFNQLSSSNTIAMWLEALDKFTRIHSEDPGFDEPLNEYRDKAAAIIEKIKAITIYDKNSKTEDEIGTYLDFVSIIEAGEYSNDDPRLDSITDKIDSAKIIHGLHKKTYHIVPVTPKNEDIPETPAAGDDIQAAAPVKKSVDAENGLKIFVNKNLKIEIEIFKKHLDKHVGYLRAILSCSTWLIHYTSEQLGLLLKIYKTDYSEEKCKEALEYLVDKGYLVCFQIPGQDVDRYALCQNIKSKMAGKEIRKAVEAGGISLAMKGYGYMQNITSVPLDGIYAIEERNRALLDAVDYVSGIKDPMAAKEMITGPLGCGIACYYIETLCRMGDVAVF